MPKGPKNFSKVYVADDGTPMPVHVNRRGCKGRWTKESDEMLRRLVDAVHRMTPEQVRAASERQALSPEPQQDTPTVRES